MVGGFGERKSPNGVQGQSPGGGLGASPIRLKPFVESESVRVVRRSIVVTLKVTRNNAPYSVNIITLCNNT